MLKVFSDRRCLEHRAPPGYPERAARLERILEELPQQGFPVVQPEAAPEAESEIRAVHEADYVERFHRAVERGDGLLDSADNPLSEATWSASLAAVETTLAAAEWVMASPRRVALAAVRPPGHHAERSFAMGFCYFNNVAIAAEYLGRRHRLEKVAIFDFDVHHGNGTQHLFEERSDVFYASVHQYPFYPGTGGRSEVGRGAGEGATLNVPLRAGTGDAGYAEAMEEEILPALEAFRPQALLVSAGFDAWRRDPLGGMGVTAAGFEEWGRQLGKLAGASCEGRVLAVLEGGYDLEALPRLVALHLRGLEAGLGG
jgi:acetoin utilization deacetylase AcuC-like enzyme